LEDVARRQGELTLSPTGGVLVAQDEVRMSELLSYAKLARHVLLRPAPTVAILRAGCDLAALLEELGERGFSGVILEEPTLTPAK
jgi:riboflavin biosynthesis pyrimidine reductase